MTILNRRNFIRAISVAPLIGLPFSSVIGDVSISPTKFNHVLDFALKHNNSKILVLSPSFRESKRILEEIWGGVMNGKFKFSSRVIHSSHDLSIKLDNGSIIITMPINDTDKIRGIRADFVIFNDCKNIPKKTIETIVFGFAAIREDNISVKNRIIFL